MRSACVFFSTFPQLLLKGDRETMNMKRTATLLLFMLLAMTGCAAIAEQPQTLVISGYDEDDASRLFMQEHPDILLKFADDKFFDSESLKQSILTGDRECDIYTINNDWGLQSLAEKGFTVDLSGQESIAGACESWYPQIREAVSHEDRVIAYPVALDMELWGVNRALESEMNELTEPRSGLDLVQSLSKAEALGEELGVNYVMEVPQKAWLIRRLIRQELIVCEKNQTRPDFSRPEILETLDAIRALPESEPMDEWAYDLLMQRPTYLSLGEDPLDSLSAYRLICPVSMSGKPAAETRLTVMIINPNSEHIDAALKYLAFRAEHEQPRLRYLLSPDLSEPIENPEYASLAAERRERVAQLEQALSAAQDDPEKADEIESEIAFEKQSIENEDNRWIISKPRLAEYRDVARHMVILTDSPILSVSGETLFDSLLEASEPFLAGKMSAEQFARQLEERFDMTYQEQ